MGIGMGVGRRRWMPTSGAKARGWRNYWSGQVIWQRQGQGTRMKATQTWQIHQMGSLLLGLRVDKIRYLYCVSCRMRVP